MNRRELEKLIDNEVIAILGSVNIREPQPEPSEVPVAPMKTRAELSGEELDDIIFYGGEKPETE